MYATNNRYRQADDAADITNNRYRQDYATNMNNNRYRQADYAANNTNSRYLLCCLYY